MSKNHWQQIMAGGLALAFTVSCAEQALTAKAPSIDGCTPKTEVPPDKFLTPEVVENCHSEILSDFLANHPEYNNRSDKLTSFRINVGGQTFDTINYELTDEELKNAEVIIANVDTDSDGITDTNIATIQNIKTFTTSQSGDWKELQGVAVPNTDGSITYKWSIGGLYEIFDVNVTQQGYQTILFRPDAEIEGWDGFTPFVISSLPPRSIDRLARRVLNTQPVATVTIVGQNGEVLATSTPTPEPTATEAPKLPEVNLDLNGDGVTDYVGRIKESKNIDIPEGEPARFELIKIGSVSEYHTVSTYTTDGYITGYDIVTISNGSREIDLTFLRVKYFRKNRPPVTVEFSFLKTLADQYGFKGEASLGKQASIEITTPSGSDFTEQARRIAKDNMNVLDFEFSIVFPEGAQWLHAEEIVQLLKTSKTDLDFKFKTDPFGISFTD